MKLTKSEEQLMEIIWQQEKVFLKDIMQEYPDPKPAGTTIATLLKRMQDKDFVAYETFGNSRQYFALVRKADYFSKEVSGIIKNYFNNSALQFASFFTSSSNITPKELEDLKKIIDVEIKRRGTMTAYLINFVLCSGLLLLIYRLLLANENLYRFNRFYLLFSLAFSLIVPLVTMEIPAKIVEIGHRFIQPTVVTEKMPVVQDEIQEETTQQIVPFNTNRSDNKQTTAVAPQVFDKEIYQQIAPVGEIDHKPYLLPAFYLLIALGLLSRFTWNLYTIKRSVTENEINTIDGAKLVLVDEDVTSHSFLSYVFVNKSEYSSGAIEPEIICHEQTHVRQLHSLDIILVELFQAIFWFNPFIPFYRRAIQLNHEFLADEAVVKSYDDTSAYQFLLLAKASQSGSLYLTSQFNYLTTKKRLIMMTKNTSAKIALYKRLALAPVLAGAVLIFSNKTFAGQPVKPTEAATKVIKQQPVKKDIERLKYTHKPIPASATDAPQSVLDEFTAILKKHHQPVTSREESKLKTEITGNDKWRLEVLFAQMSKAQQRDQYIQFIVPFPMPGRSYATEKQLAEWQDAVQYGVWIDNKRVKNTELAKYKASDFDHVFFSRLTPLAVKNDKFHFQVDLMTIKGYAKWRDETLAADTDWRLNRWMRMDPVTKEATQIKTKDFPRSNKTSVGKTKDDANKEAYQVTQIPYDAEGRDIATSKTDAPQSVIDEYTSILKKNSLPYKKGDAINLNPNISGADREKLKALYIQMSRKQQHQQYVWVMKKDPLPFKYKHQPPTQDQLNKWANSPTPNYLVTIDDHWLKNNKELSKYKLSDFIYGDQSGPASEIYKNTKDGMKVIKGTFYNVHLETNGHFEKALKEMQSKREWAMAKINGGRETLTLANW